jgi:hypothetical protein
MEIHTKWHQLYQKKHNNIDTSGKGYKTFFNAVGINYGKKVL